MDGEYSHEPMEVRLFTREGVRALDRAAERELGIPGILLMENAAASIEEAARAIMRERTLDRVLIFAGPGANGGDGFALARRLTNRGARVALILAFDPARARGDAGTNLMIAQRMGIPIEPLDPANAAPDKTFEPARTLVVDALLGTGADRAPEGLVARAIDRIEALRGVGAVVLAVDLPSGLDCDTGEPLGDCCVRADLTVTLAGMKRGLVLEPSRERAGRVLVGDIGVPPELLRRFGAAMPAAGGC